MTMPEFSLLNRSRQITEYSCGPAAVQSVLSYWDRDVDQQKLMQVFRTTEEVGTYPEDMVSGLRTLGLNAEMTENCTLDQVAEFTSHHGPVIALGQVWRSQSGPATSVADDWGSGHYFVVLAVDRENVYFQDPYLGMCKGFVPRDVFEEHWHQAMGGDLNGRKLMNVAIFIRGEKTTASAKEYADVDVSKLDFRKLGSINLLVTQFAGELLPYDLMDEMRTVFEGGVIRADAFILLRKDKRGRLSAVEGGRVQGDADLPEVNTLVAAIATQSISGPQTVRSAAEAAARAAAKGDFGLSTTELAGIAEKLPNDHTAIILLVENVWERQFKRAAAKYGGKVITQRVVTSETIGRIADGFFKEKPKVKAPTGKKATAHMTS
jgi:predicted double-glycine peptidase